MAGLNVVALISGGKDSFFSILHCEANGHKVVALANLHPPVHDKNGQAEDLESFMYQTIGHKVIPCYEQALGLPLYRQEIDGGASYKSKDYAADYSHDETESLIPLLRKVIAAHPEVNAVSTGAILSDYQRTRVESVALRLGLTPLSYLWQWPFLPPGSQSSLLEDMTAVGQDARIIKVASGGLDETFLWQNVAEPRTIARLKQASQKFGSADDGAVLGEGGEYETLAIGGPPPLWKGHISVHQDCIKVIPGEAGSASLQLKSPHVELFGKDELSQATMPPRIPSLLDPRFEQLQSALLSADSQQPDLDTGSFLERCDQAASSLKLFENITGAGATPEAQTRSIMERVKAELPVVISETTYSIIILRNMSDFAAVNAVYGRYFNRPNPPARLTIACADVLPAEALLSISIVVAPGRRQGLHVQSRSYWAPANIGPYSQAIKQTMEDGDGIIQESCYIAGQIPLVPASMALPSEQDKDSFTLQSLLALQHLDRIGRVMHVKHWTFGIAFLSCQGIDGSILSKRADIARRTWAGYQRSLGASTTDLDESEDESFDVWHLSHGSGKPWLSQMRADAPSGLGADQKSTAIIPPLLVITADSLPRNADIEWIGFGSSHAADDMATVPCHLRGLVKNFRRRILPTGTNM
ncbi:Diphthine--ammonia ligase [Pseudocercospora fuligena]|uniref:Diphthine--ammonia ligase n=1 Tax=Pseudocercospora fuligena TaxID=685502 RepID=A0A8H6RMY1_9PEZI|nr:Diphthine--ammonia ligase [Pseudocercospora fuligena]